MKRDSRLRQLSWDHHHGLVMALRIERELAEPNCDVGALYSALIGYWSAGLLPHFRVEGECLLARLVRHVPSADPVVSQTLTDHLDLASLVAKMRDASDLSTRREALADFGTKLRAHIRWEESVLFELTQQQLEDAELDRLAEDIAAYSPVLVPAPTSRQE